MSGMPEQIGPYVISREIGRGGMGVVYLGRDTRLDRDVAIKALPEHLATDPERLARFEREAKTLASLNHPNVAGIHGIEKVDGAQYLVLEYVEGQTLAERLDGGSLGTGEVIDIAVQIASGIEAAHEAGVIHRDLKPANIKITPDGDVKVLDFGLARATDDGGSSSSMSQLPTLTSPAMGNSPTVAGVILGTAAYMSPEQARGRRVDKRTDIWSFGVVLYEMMMGASPFAGETVGDSIGAILHKPIDLGALPAGVPAHVRRVLERCLERDKKNRYRDIGDVRMDLLRGGHVAEVESVGSRGLLAVGVALVIGLMIGGVSVWQLATGMGTLSGGATRVPQRFTITLPENIPVAPPSAHPFGIARGLFDLSPDGGSLVYTALVDGRSQLALRDMRTGNVELIDGTENGYGPVFAPDGNRISFFANEMLYRLDVTRNSPPEQLAGGMSSPGGLAWSRDDVLYFNGLEAAQILSLPASGGDMRAATPATEESVFHRYPSLTPDESHLVYAAFTKTSNLHITPLDDPEEQRTLMPEAGSGVIHEPGVLLFTRENRLMGVAVDRATYEPVDTPVTLVSGMRASWSKGQFVLSDQSVLVYADGMEDQFGRFVWYDKDGNQEPLDLGLEQFYAFALSPDGRRLATPIVRGDQADIWIYDLDRPQTPTRVTFGGFHNNVKWSTNGRFLVFGHYLSEGGYEIMAVDTRSGGDPVVLHTTSGNGGIEWYDNESGELGFTQSSPGKGMDLMVGQVVLDGDQPAMENVRTLRGTRYSEAFAAVSPDRRWIVAVSNETGRWELYLSTYPDFGQRVQISTTGGEEPIWTDDGTRIIYRWNDSWYEVEVTTEPELSVSLPRPIVRGAYINVPGYSWDMTGDGERLLLLEGPQQDAPVTELQVITNFDVELERLLSND